MAETATKIFTKPLKGVITNWQREPAGKEEVIVGLCAFHVDAVPFDVSWRSPGNLLVEGYEMQTSTLETLHEGAGYALAETKNSIYILISPWSATADMAKDRTRLQSANAELREALEAVAARASQLMDDLNEFHADPSCWEDSMVALESGLGLARAALNRGEG